ncbi:uncharacterized protein LOC131288457 [Anopheles ziemanni]|uniref:uncharacterized protein LOC131259182 n=1 Tax=Anopheles coustani TaxID=139045 RepID=UPI002657B06A|nr:uncharacterized protein LOC131259182 [Anopheles coustani]XP_058173574.1 uncharacterized protein LOC131288457 [Anopheles ziemanni]
MDCAFETTYSQDYKNRLDNRRLALLHKMDANLPESCFSPPIPCTVAVGTGVDGKKNIDIESEVKRKDFPQWCTNRFRKNLAKTHPELYAEIDAERPWQERAGGSPLISSYQLAFDRLPEQPSCPASGVSESPRWPDWKYFQRECNGVPPCSGKPIADGGPCSCQLCPQEQASSSNQKRPPTYGCVYSISNIPKSYISSGHWPEMDWEKSAPNKTEYRDRVGRLGGVIQRENIHNHSRCTPTRNCRHKFFL